MANKITTLYSDSAKTDAVFPRTKTSAVSDVEGNVLGNVAVYNATTLSSGVNTVKVGVDMDLLWTNSSPSSDFAAQTVAVDLTNYSLIMILYRPYKSNTSCLSVLMPKGETVRLSASTDINSYREATASTQGLSFGDALQYTTYNNNTSSSNISRLVPYKIYGVR